MNNQDKFLTVCAICGRSVEIQDSQYADQPDFWRELRREQAAGKAVELRHSRCAR